MSAEGLQNLGFNYGKPAVQGVCAVCEQTLSVRATRINDIEVIDLHCCGYCGRIYTEGARGLLVQLGRRELCKSAETTNAKG